MLDSLMSSLSGHSHASNLPGMLTEQGMSREDAAYYQHELNREIRAGEWRPLDVRAAPFGARAVVITTLRAPKVRARSWKLRGKFNAGTKPVMLLHGNGARPDQSADA